MRPTKEIIERIIELEVENDPEGEGYLDEGQQAELSSLYSVMEGEDLSDLDDQIEQAREKWREENVY